MKMITDNNRSFKNLFNNLIDFLFKTYGFMSISNNILDSNNL